MKIKLKTIPKYLLGLPHYLEIKKELTTLLIENETLKNENEELKEEIKNGLYKKYIEYKNFPKEKENLEKRILRLTEQRNNLRNDNIELIQKYTKKKSGVKNVKKENK